MNTGRSGVLVHAVSGGVDSSVAAYLLEREWDRPELGRRMVCANHYIWPGAKCCSPEVIKRARGVSKRLGLPFYSIDLTEVFERRVVEDFIDTYVAGRTPNPCVRCNEKMRFSVFYQYMRELLQEENVLHTDETLFFSTGHYVGLEQNDEGIFLKRAADRTKDQSYMLYRVKKEMLPKLVFPLGSYTKKEVVREAEDHDFPTSSVKESQDICFIDGPYGEFLLDRITDEKLLKRLQEPGPIVDTHGTFLGRHKGFIHYTVGQRRGLDLGNGPWYVVEVDAAANTVIVGRKEESLHREFSVGGPNWFIEPPKTALSCDIKVRYNTPALSGKIMLSEGPVVRVILDSPAVITPGQSAVFYKNDLVLGGGIIL